MGFIGTMWDKKYNTIPIWFPGGRSFIGTMWDKKILLMPESFTFLTRFIGTMWDKKNDIVIKGKVIAKSFIGTMWDKKIIKNYRKSMLIYQVLSELCGIKSIAKSTGKAKGHTRFIGTMWDKKGFLIYYIINCFRWFYLNYVG